MSDEMEVLMESEVWACARFAARLCLSLLDAKKGHITREIYLEDIVKVLIINDPQEAFEKLKKIKKHLETVCSKKHCTGVQIELQPQKNLFRGVEL